MTAPALDLSLSVLDRLRRRSHGSLVAGVALGSTGHIAASTVSTIAAQQIAGSTAWSGAPGAAAVLGAALGAVLLSQLMVRSGRRTGLAAGYAVAVCGAILATVGVAAGSMVMLLGGTVLIGFGNASNQLSRYVAADLYPPERRASALGLVVGGATVGAIIGPNLAAPAASLATNLGLPPISGAYLVPVVFVGAAAILSFVALRPDPYALADRSSRHDQPGGDRSTAATLAIRAQPTERARRDPGARDRPGRDDPGHDDDPAPDDGPRPRPRRGRDRHQRPHPRHVRVVPDLGPSRPIGSGCSRSSSPGWA